MLDSFRRSNIAAHISAGSYYNSKMKGVLHSLEHKVGVHLTNEQIAVTAAALS
jgi:hypothetical protein